MDIARLKMEFVNIYNLKDINIYTFFSPSRINLIGEHIDYNGGKVLPCAIKIGTYGLVRRREDSKVRLSSTNSDISSEIDLKYLVFDKKDGWINYPKGVIYCLQKEGYKISGMDILVSGNSPNAAGLSSSASLELLIAEMINILFNDGKIPKIDLIRACQRAENDFIGVKCGIMDQFAVYMGRENKAILLDCDTLNFRYVDIAIGNYALIVMNTNKRRELSDSKYNERRLECEEALNNIKQYKEINNLCELTTKEFEYLGKYIVKENIRKRACHVVHESERVQKAYESLEKNDIRGLGKLIIESNNSLRDLYEVTGRELDTIVDAAIGHRDCIGARMTGAGFGGCAIAFVKNDCVDNFIKYVGSKYEEKIGYRADFYLVEIGDGTRKIE